MAQRLAYNNNRGSLDRRNARYSAKSRKRGPWRVVFWVALVVLAVSVAALGFIAFTYWNGQKAYEDLHDELTLPQDPAAATLADFSVDWDALRATNPDVVGWIYMPDTVVNYPIVHRDGDDGYYLKRNFNGETTGQFGAEYGCIMLSGENGGDFTDEVNIVYGHHMANGTMFGLFADFVDSKVFNEHRTVYIFTPQGNYRLNTFSVNHINETDTTIVVPNQTSDQLKAYVQKLLNSSIVKPDLAAPAAANVKQVFAFSTCDASNGSYRYITFASVEEYLPAGSATSKENSLINPADVTNVGDAADSRVQAG